MTRGRKPSNGISEKALKMLEEIDMSNVEIKTEHATKKKGNPTWKPASLLDVRNKQDGYNYRFVRKDADNIAKKSEEGWEMVSSMNDKAERDAPYGRAMEGKALSTVQEGSDWVLMRIPEEMAMKRAEYYNQLTDTRTKAIMREAKQAAGGDSRIKGNIKIDRETTLIE